MAKRKKNKGRRGPKLDKMIVEDVFNNQNRYGGEGFFIKMQYFCSP